MLKIIFAIAAVFQFSNAFAQRSFREFVDSSVEADHFLDGDWAIGYYTEQGGYMPEYDSSGNVYLPSELFSTIVIYNIKNIFYLQRFTQQYSSEDACFHASKRIQLQKGVGINYTVDSIEQAREEWIYQYIYKNDLGAYVYQEDSPHSPSYVLDFFTPKLNTSKYFTEICLSENLRFDKSLPKNLNYALNINTFTCRAFLAVKHFIETNRKLIPLD